MAVSSEISELQESLKTRSLEQAYEKSAHAIETILQDENARKLRLHILLLEDENDDLHEQLTQNDDHVDVLEGELGERQERLVELEFELRRAQSDARSKTRELEGAKAEVKSYAAMSANSTKLLTEKLALSNELANLRPELEHLRSQMASNQGILSEKLSLQRQMSALQVELETERRTTQRLSEKDEKENTKEAKIESQLEGLRKDLAKEKRDRERIEKESKKSLADWESRREVLESKLEAMRDKLRTTKDRLKDSQSQLQEAHETASAATKNASLNTKTVPAKNPRKRTAAEADFYAAIGTPDGVAGAGRGRAAKRNKRSSTLPGEKSTFSMTPFLSRTSLAPESPGEKKSSEEDAETQRLSVTEEGQEEPELASPSPSAQKSFSVPSIVERKAPGAKRVLDKSQPAKRNARTANRTNAPLLEQVIEEGNDDNEPPADDDQPTALEPKPPAPKPKVSLRAPSEEPEAKKKKIKLLSGGPGKTLFDEGEVAGYVVSPKGVARHASSGSSKRWQERQGRDRFAREAKVQGLKSRAAFKLLEINDRYKIFKRGQTVVDLGYAPGSWSQVAADRTSPNGRVLGIDIIPAEPPRGVSTLQGNFLSPAIRAEVQRFLADPDRGRPTSPQVLSEDPEELTRADDIYIDLGRNSSSTGIGTTADGVVVERARDKEREEGPEKTVDVVLSDMCEPWEQTTGFHSRTISDPYFRMMNTSGLAFRDHAGSMDLCAAALQFCARTLRSNGSFVCKFYAGAEDKLLETRLKRLFNKVHREKPESSRKESREAYFVALRRKADVREEDVFAE
ncbi:MAG: 2' O-ribose methyltransferase [Chaenotheca gracillima]|nr:MAG: 2' O-ribose methyltransferase [Chaenotheca gracillima]